ncbi:MAG: hypothetical protein ABIU87_06975 [Ornithinibacter sp.]
MGETWQEVAARQAGVLNEPTLRALKVSRAFVRHQVRSGRWAERTHSVYTTTTGPLSPTQLRWVAVEHAGPNAMLGGLTAMAVHGLANWSREDVTVLVAAELSFEPIEGVRFIRTRRSPDLLRTPRMPLRTCRVEPAVLLFAAHEPHPRTALGAVAATVQQRLASTESLMTWTRALRPLRRAASIRELLDDISGGSQSLAEVDLLRLCRRWGLAPPRRQRRRRDRDGRTRFTDCEWDLPDGRVLVLEVDGAFHLDIAQYTDDVRRQRQLTTDRRIIVRCTAQEVRKDAAGLLKDLIALGVPRTA